MVSLKQIGDAVQRTESWASKRLRVYADSVLSGYVQSGTLAAAVAEEFLSVQDTRTRKRLADQAVAHDWTKDEARGHARRLRVDRQIGELERLTRLLIDELATLDPLLVPVGLRRDLEVLRGRIETLPEPTGPRRSPRRARTLSVSR